MSTINSNIQNNNSMIVDTFDRFVSGVVSVSTANITTRAQLISDLSMPITTSVASGSNNSKNPICLVSLSDGSFTEGVCQTNKFGDNEENIKQKLTQINTDNYIADMPILTNNSDALGIEYIELFDINGKLSSPGKLILSTSGNNSFVDTNGVGNKVSLKYTPKVLGSTDQSNPTLSDTQLTITQQLELLDDSTKNRILIKSDGNYITVGSTTRLIESTDNIIANKKEIIGNTPFDDNQKVSIVYKCIYKDSNNVNITIANVNIANIDYSIAKEFLSFNVTAVGDKTFYTLKDSITIYDKSTTTEDKFRHLNYTVITNDNYKSSTLSVICPILSHPNYVFYRDKNTRIVDFTEYKNYDKSTDTLYKDDPTSIGTTSSRIVLFPLYMTYTKFVRVQAPAMGYVAAASYPIKSKQIYYEAYSEVTGVTATETENKNDYSSNFSVDNKTSGSMRGWGMRVSVSVKANYERKLATSSITKNSSDTSETGVLKIKATYSTVRDKAPVISAIQDICKNGIN